MKDNLIKEKKYFIYALIIKLLLVIIFSYVKNLELPEKTIFTFFGSIHNDYGYFITPVENYIKNGLYSYNGKEPFAGRLPGYAIIYYFFRLFSNQETSNLLLIVFQLIISALGSLAFAFSAQNIFQRKEIFHIAFWLSLLYPVSSFFDYQTITEGLAFNFLIFSIYFISKINKSRNNKLFLILSGLFFIWAVFLRPYLAILGPVFAIYLIDFSQLKYNFKLSLHNSILWIVPAIFIMSIWNIRNFKQFDKIVILQTRAYDSYGKLYSYSWIHMRKMMFSWGGETGYFMKDSDAHWFRKDKTNSEPPMPNHIYEKECFTKNDLITLKKEYQNFYYTDGFDRIADTTIALKAIKYRECYESKRSFSEFIFIYIKTIRKLTLNSGSAYMPNFKNSIIQKTLKAYFFVMYYLLLLMAFFGFVFSKNARIFLIPIITLIVALILYTPMLEHRYFLGVFPFVMLLSVAGVDIIYNRFIKKNNL
jgi:hypothetical protein